MKRLVSLIFLIIVIQLISKEISNSRLRISSIKSYIEKDVTNENKMIFCTIRTKLGKEELRRMGIDVQTKVKDFATVRILTSELENLVLKKEIDKVLLLGSDKPCLDESTSDLMKGSIYASCNADSLQTLGFDGSGVLVGILDYYPLNWKHEDFYETHWNTDVRVLNIWDQTDDTGTNPNGFSYGSEYSQADLLSDNGPAISGGSHSTQCVGIIAGDGSASGSGNPKLGFAPNAEIVYVRKKSSGENTIDAFSYFTQKADEYNKPMVVSFSGGSRYGITDGTDPVSIAIDNFASSGRIAVVAAGNYYTTTKHAQSTTLFNSSTQDITIEINGYSNTGTEQFDDFLDCIFYFQDGDNFNVSVTDPDGNLYETTVNDDDESFETDFGKVYIFHNDYPNIEVVVTDETGSISVGDTWQFGLSCPDESYDDAGGVWSAWLYEDNITGNFTNYGTGENTLNYYASGSSSVSVGAFYKVSGSLYSGCSAGMTIDNRMKPDLCAPTNAEAPNISGTDTYSALGATSGAAPHCAGAIALLYQMFPTFSSDEIISLLHNSAVTDSNTDLYGSIPNFRYGYGKLNCPNAYHLNAISSVSKEISQNGILYSFDDNDETGIDITFSGLSNAETISVSKFSYSPIRTYDKTNISTYHWLISGSGFNEAEIFIDIDKVSGIGDASTVDVVRRSLEGTIDTLETSVQENSLLVTDTTFGTLWLQSEFSENPLPIILSHFSAKSSSCNSILQWTTETETNNLGWNVYRSNTAEWDENVTKINISGLIDGAGTTFSPTSYTQKDWYEFTNNEMCFYWLESIDYSGISKLFPKLSFIFESDEEMTPPDVFKLELSQNIPNPFNPITKIFFTNNKAQVVSISVYNLKGEKINTLTNELYEIGDHYVAWNGTDSNGLDVCSGIYFYKLIVDDKIITKKCLLLK